MKGSSRGRKARRDAKPQTVVLSPGELAEALGLPAEDGPYITQSPLRLPAEWVATMRGRIGALDLTAPDVALITGESARTVIGWCRNRHLLSRRVGQGGAYRISPSALVQFRRQQAATLGHSTTIFAETPTQQKRRFAREKAYALKVLRG